MIAVVDYGMGNLRSVSKALEAVGGRVRVTGDAGEVSKADKVVLPGVGAFEKAAAALAAGGLDEAVKGAIWAGRPFFGICLGLQLLFETSHEDGAHSGLGVFSGEVVRFERDMARPQLKIPHIGWNQVEITSAAPHFAGIPPRTYFYFVHSYYVAPADNRIVAGRSEYLRPFAAAVWQDNVFASQFHPEKSQKWGLKLLENFVAL